MLLIALMVGIVGGVAAQDEAKVLVTGRQMSASDVPTLDPSITQDVPSVQIEWELFPGLARFHEETSALQPGMATWDVSDDGLVYTFHILENVPWVRYNADTGAVEEVTDDSGNVRYVTAGDFAFGIQRSLDPDTASPYLYVIQPWIAGAYDFEADNSDPSVLGLNVVDDNTLEVTVTAVSSVTPAIFDMWVTYAVPQWLVEEYGDFWIDPENIATFGPFALKEWVRGDGGSLTMIKNPFWPGT
ncbi:MAG: hypothetical protein IT319_03445, partial [Anaerolineae bacterium]|nr:hypothetical protein [Anaerolineae bacterium]